MPALVPGKAAGIVRSHFLTVPASRSLSHDDRWRGATMPCSIINALSDASSQGLARAGHCRRSDLGRPVIFADGGRVAAGSAPSITFVTVSHRPAATVPSDGGAPPSAVTHRPAATGSHTRVRPVCRLSAGPSASDRIEPLSGLRCRDSCWAGHSRRRIARTLRPAREEKPLPDRLVRPPPRSPRRAGRALPLLLELAFFFSSLLPRPGAGCGSFADESNCIRTTTAQGLSTFSWTLRARANARRWSLRCVATRSEAAPTSPVAALGQYPGCLSPPAVPTTQPFHNRRGDRGQPTTEPRLRPHHPGQLARRGPCGHDGPGLDVLVTACGRQSQCERF